MNRWLDRASPQPQHGPASGMTSHADHRLPQATSRNALGSDQVEELAGHLAFETSDGLVWLIAWVRALTVESSSRGTRK